MRLDPSPIPKGKHTANSNRAYLSPDTTVSISGHILFIRSEADLSRRAVEGSAVFSDLCWKRGILYSNEIVFSTGA